MTKTQRVEHPSMIAKMNNFVEDHEQQGGMRICKGAFNVNCSTTKDPSTVMTEMYRALDANAVQYKQMGTYGMKCA